MCSVVIYYVYIIIMSIIICYSCTCEKFVTVRSISKVYITCMLNYTSTQLLFCYYYGLVIFIVSHFNLFCCHTPPPPLSPTVFGANYFSSFSVFGLRPWTNPLLAILIRWLQFKGKEKLINSKIFCFQLKYSLLFHSFPNTHPYTPNADRKC